jgi:hypothetical protein
MAIPVSGSWVPILCKLPVQCELEVERLIEEEMTADELRNSDEEQKKEWKRDFRFQARKQAPGMRS